MNQINKDMNNPEKIPKNKGTQKRNNYIPKNLIINPQNVNQNNQNTSKKSNIQDYYTNLYNIYYNNILSSEHKNSSDSQNSNQGKNSSNFNNSPTHDIDNNFSNIINDMNVTTNENEENNHDNYDVFKAFSYVFDANIVDVKEILTDNLFFKNSCPESIIDNVKFTINNFSDTEGNIISFRWKKFYTLELICTKTYSSKTSIIYTLTLINLKPVNIGSLEMVFKYYYNTCQNKTLFIIEYHLDKGILSEVFKEEFLDIDMNEICTNCEKILSQRKKEQKHTSSIFFNTSKENAWDILMDLSKNKNMNYMNEYDISYLSCDNNNDNNNINHNIRVKDGDAIIIKRNKNIIFARIIIEKISIEEDINIISFKCENCINDKIENINNEENNNVKDEKNNINIINQTISLSFKTISNSICFCEFIHTWKELIGDEKVKILDLLKNNSLILLKKEIEYNSNNLNNNQSINDKNSKELNKDESSTDNDNDKNKVINLFNLLCPVKK